MSPRAHPNGHCVCATHVDRPWDRPEHWTAAEVNLLHAIFGRSSDEAIARRLGRTVCGIRLKAKRLGLRKTRIAFTARDVEGIFGLAPADGRVSKLWIARGLLRARRAPIVGRSVWIIEPEAVDAFIRDHPEWVDVERMPDSPWRDLAERDPWVSLREAHRRTGRDHHAVAQLIIAGAVRGRRRGPHWYMPLADVPLVPPLRSAEAIADSVFRRSSTLAVRKRRRRLERRSPGLHQPALPAVLNNQETVA